MDLSSFTIGSVGPLQALVVSKVVNVPYANVLNFVTDLKKTSRPQTPLLAAVANIYSDPNTLRQHLVNLSGYEWVSKVSARSLIDELTQAVGNAQEGITTALSLARAYTADDDTLSSFTSRLSSDVDLVTALSIKASEYAKTVQVTTSCPHCEEDVVCPGFRTADEVILCPHCGSPFFTGV